jgi:hypothetical protein
MEPLHIRQKLRGVLRPVPLVGFLLLMLVHPVRAGNVTYSYDQRGRLVGTVDNNILSGSNGIAYSYDAVDNITAMTPVTATSTSVFTVSPINAPAGSTVTIYGDGFNGSAVVNFGSTQASIQSYTLSTIVVTVPSIGSGPTTVSVNGVGTPFTVQ